jgi:hypothetical protein
VTLNNWLNRAFIEASARAVEAERSNLPDSAATLTSCDRMHLINETRALA